MRYIRTIWTFKLQCYFDVEGIDEIIMTIRQKFYEMKVLYVLLIAST